MTSYSRRPLIGALVAPLVAAMLALAIPTPAQADTASDLADAMAEVTELQAQAESASQRVRQAEAEHAHAVARLADLEAQLATQSAQVAATQRALGRLARASYTAGGVDAALYLLLADDGEEFAAAAQSLQRAADGVTVDLAEQRAYEQSLRRLRLQIAQEEARAERARVAAAASAQEVRTRLADAEALEAELERRYAEELAEQRRQEAEAAAHEAAAAQAALDQSETAFHAEDSPPYPGPGSTAGSGTRTTASTASGSTDQRQRIVSFALSQVGGRYIYGADGPGAYDCSGLVTAAYATAGIHLPSYTGSQVALARPVPLSEALPGDLLFYFGKGVHHVAIYLGDGRMVHAVNPSRGIRVDRVATGWYMERFTMAGRVLR